MKFIAISFVITLLLLVSISSFNNNIETSNKSVVVTNFTPPVPKTEVVPKIKSVPFKNIFPELVEDYYEAYARAKQEKKHFVVWVNQFDQDLFEAFPEAIHTKIASHPHIVSNGTVVCFYKDNDLHSLIDLSKDNSTKLNFVPLTKDNLPFIKEFMKNLN